MTIPAGRPGKVCPTLTKQVHGWSLAGNGKKRMPTRSLDECVVKAVKRIGEPLKEPK